MSNLRDIARQMRHDARMQAARAIAGTEGTADQRQRRLIETIQAGVRLEVIEGHDPIDQLGLSVPQHNAAAYLRDLWRDALPEYEAPLAYGTGAGHGGRRHLTADERLAAARAWQAYRQAMEALSARASLRHAAAVRAMVIDEAPAHPPLVREGLTVLARFWQYA